MNKVSQVRSLTPAEAARKLPVHLRGVVTAFSGLRNYFFVADNTASISVDRTDAAVVHPGDQVEIFGSSSPGDFAPVIVASRVVVLGRGVLPHPRTAAYTDLVGGSQDGQWIEVQGVVQAFGTIRQWGRPVVQISLHMAGGSIFVFLQNDQGLNYTGLVDASVRLRGVCATVVNRKKQFSGAVMWIPTVSGVTVLKSGPPDPFAIPEVPIQSILQFASHPQNQHRILVKGAVTYVAAGQYVYIQQGQDAVGVILPTDQQLAIGQEVEAVGFPTMRDYSPTLEDALLRPTGNSVTVSPERIAAKNVTVQVLGYYQAPNDQQLIQVEGEIVKSYAEGDQHIWFLQDHGQVFEASLASSLLTPNLKSLREGSTVGVTGICIVHAKTDKFPYAFRVLLRSGDDFSVLKRASWWTTQRALSLLAVITSLLILILAWIVALRRRVFYQTRTIRASEERFRELAQLDVLTGLPNRLMLEDRIEACLAACARDELKAAVLTVDIDRFKQINDTYGHPIGDEVLKAFAQRLQSRIRTIDTVARTGGEEFTIIAGRLRDHENAGKVAAELIALFHQPLILTGHEIKLTISIGGAVYPDDGTICEDLRKHSDIALYAAKKAGGNCAVFASEELSKSTELASAVETLVRNEIECNGFCLHYQPIYDAEQGIRRFEALLRANHPRLVELGPGTFIPIAEETGLIIPLGAWIVNESCRQIAEWMSDGRPCCPVAVNISARQLIHKGFAESILDALDRHGVDPPMLELEITETTVMTNLEVVAETIARMAGAGITFSIDDFGTGHSSLSRISELPLRGLKIDRSFVANLEHSQTARTIVLAILQMSKGLRLEVVAEGVEQWNQFALLKEMGCQLYQGYLFDRPLSAARAIETLMQNRGVLTLGG